MGLKNRKIIGILCSLIFISSFFFFFFQSYYSLREEQRIAVGDTLELPLKLPVSILNNLNVRVKDGEKLLNVEGHLLEGKSTYYLGLNSPVVTKPGRVSLELRLFGLIPLKKINVDVLPNVRLIPGGHSIGVLLRTEGVMVVGHSPILKENGVPVLPAKEADIEVGDLVIEVNGEKVVTDEQIGKLIHKYGNNGQGVELSIKRHGRNYKRIVYPQYCNDTQTYRIGLYVRDNAGGVGTLTFVEPLSRTFGALGHVITDAESNQKLLIRQGKIVNASVEGIRVGKRGLPGEKVGMFVQDTEFGSINKNENCGIYGTVDKLITNPIYTDSLPIAYSGQIQTGKAQILTVVKGEKIETFEITIEKVMSARRDGKNMIIKITDEVLLQATGGIVQGMSGSPIIQDGKIIGAVTHVFVNDPTRGYGVFIENMLFEAGILTQDGKILGLRSQDFSFYSLLLQKTG